MTAVLTRTRTKSVPNLRPDEYAAMRALTLAGFGGYGAMQPELDARRHDDDAYATYIRNAEGKIVGWALTFRARRGVHEFGTGSKGTINTYFFVHPEYRRMGIGTKLYRAVRRRFGIVKVHPWNRQASSFFAKVGAV